MALPATIKAWLAQQRIPYTIHKHKVAYTAQEIAAAQHVSGKQLAKCVLVTTDQGPRLAVLAATHLIDFKRLKAALKLKRVSLAKESEIKRAFPDMEVGAMPPFGSVYGVAIVLDQGLVGGQELVCNAGSHTETMTFSPEDLVRAERPVVASFSVPIAPPAKKKAGATPKGKSKAKKPAGRTVGKGRSGKKPARSSRAKPAPNRRRR